MSEEKLVESSAWAENDPEGLLDFAGSSECVATEVYLPAAKPVLVPATARESIAWAPFVPGQSQPATMWPDFRDKSLIVSRLLCSFCNSEFPQTATLSFWVRAVRIPRCESSHSHARSSTTEYRSYLPVLSISTPRTGRTTIASLDNTWFLSAGHCLHRILPNPPIASFPEPRLAPELSESATDY